MGEGCWLAENMKESGLLGRMSNCHRLAPSGVIRTNHFLNTTQATPVICEMHHFRAAALSADLCTSLQFL